MRQRSIFNDGDGMQIGEEFRNVSALLCSSPEKFLTRDQMNPREILDGHLSKRAEPGAASPGLDQINSSHIG